MNKHHLLIAFSTFLLISLYGNCKVIVESNGFIVPDSISRLSEDNCVKAITYINKAEEYYAKKNIPLTISNYQTAFDICPSSLNQTGLYTLGYLYSRNNNYELGIKFIELTIDKGSSSRDDVRIAYTLLGNNHRILKNYDIAIACYQKAYSYHTDSSKITDSRIFNFLIAFSYYGKDDYPNAIKHFNGVIEFRLLEISATLEDVTKNIVRDDKLGESFSFICTCYANLMMIDEYTKYLKLAALCGHESSISLCDDFNLDYMDLYNYDHN